MSSHKILLLTGIPGIGKTTAILRAVRGLASDLGVRCSGFYTREIREDRFRKGFEIFRVLPNEAAGLEVSSREKRIKGNETITGVMAHVDFKEPKVGRYGVNLDVVDSVAVDALDDVQPGQVIVIDEIGTMECLSPQFRDELPRALDKATVVIGTVASQGSSFIQKVKQRPDVLIIVVTIENRDYLPSTLMKFAVDALEKNNRKEETDRVKI